MPPATVLVVVQSRSRSQANVQRDERNLRFPPRTWTRPAQSTIAVAFKSRQRPKSVSGDSGVGDETSALPVMDSQRQYFIRTPGIGVGHQRPACAPTDGMRASSKPVTPLANIRRFALILRLQIDHTLSFMPRHRVWWSSTLRLPSLPVPGFGRGGVLPQWALWDPTAGPGGSRPSHASCMSVALFALLRTGKARIKESACHSEADILSVGIDVG